MSVITKINPALLIFGITLTHILWRLTAEGSIPLINKLLFSALILCLLFNACLFDLLLRGETP